MPLLDLVSHKRVLVTCGAGGVGKTTTAAALALAGARLGKRVLCLTIDPAKRLAQSLGLDQISGEATRIDPVHFQRAQLSVPGTLTAMMLDTKRTFDDLVRKRSSTPAQAERLLKNKLYRYVSGSLAGTQEYMAMEKLAEVQDDPDYDLVVLDTPPTTNALDFLSAPERMTEALDSAAIRWFVEAFQGGKSFSLNLLARGAQAVLRGLGKITGGEFLQDMAEFVAELNDLFGGFRERAEAVQGALRGPSVAFVVVAAPTAPSLEEALFFSERLSASQMPLGALVVNRVRRRPGFAELPPAARQVEAFLRACNMTLGEGGAERLLRAHAEASALAAYDEQAVLSHLGRWLRSPGHAPLVGVAELATDVHDVRLLGEIGEILIRGGNVSFPT